MLCKHMKFCATLMDYFVKVALIMGIMGACRSKEMHAMKLEDIQDLEKAFLITIPNTKTNSVRQFTVTGSFHKICKKYADLRPANVTTSSFFLNYQHGRCTPQKIGINKFGLMGKQIATYLNLPNANLYTGHCFRRSSATMPADIGGYDGSQTTTNNFI
jgi:integrase